MKKIITVLTYEEKVKQCLKEADALNKGDFLPELDNMEAETINNILWKVLHEWDLATEGETKVPKRHLQRAEKFMARWKEYIEVADQKEMYDNFN